MINAEAVSSVGLIDKASMGGAKKASTVTCWLTSSMAACGSMWILYRFCGLPSRCCHLPSSSAFSSSVVSPARTAWGTGPGWTAMGQSQGCTSEKVRWRQGGASLWYRARVGC